MELREQIEEILENNNRENSVFLIKKLIEDNYVPKEKINLDCKHSIAYEFKGKCMICNSLETKI